jgi:hypothetical protein
MAGSRRALPLPMISGLLLREWRSLTAVGQVQQEQPHSAAAAMSALAHKTQLRSCFI